MDVPAVFAAPDPVAFRVKSDRSCAEVVTGLKQAVAERRYSTPGRYANGFFRLGGWVGSELLTVTAKPYLIPGVIAGFAAMTIELSGKVVPTEEGSEIRGTVTAPIPRAMRSFVALALVPWLAFGIAGNGLTWPTLVFLGGGGSLVLAAWAWTIRHNQRMALGNVNELARILDAVIADTPPPKNARLEQGSEQHGVQRAL